MNTLMRAILVSRAKGAVVSASALREMGHAVTKGLLREIIIRELLRPLLPASAGIGQGIVVSAFEEQSSQQDIVIYHRELIPSLLLDQTNGVFPIESVISCLEVKSRLTSVDLLKAQKDAGDLTHQVFAKIGIPYPEMPLCWIFAFTSDLKSEGEELNRYLKLLGGAIPHLKGICVVGKGYHHFENQSWHTVTPDSDHVEVVAFVADLVSYYDVIQRTRASPSLRAYCLPD
jgi:hypothetical protein